MSPAKLWIGGFLAVALGIAVVGKNNAQSPPAATPPDIVQVKKQTSSEGATTQPLPVDPTAQASQLQSGAQLPAAASSGSATPPPATQAPPMPTNATPGTGLGAGNIQATASTDVGGALTNTSANGVEIQRRNNIVADPRVRGYRTGQLVNLADGAFFFPSRQDLDTAISKFDPGSIYNVEVINGPYATRFGPGFAFIDIITFDTPRAYREGEAGFHGRTFLGYKSNGDQWNGLQSVQYGGQDWGVRLGYNILSGNDYQAGNGQDVPGSYNSQNVNFAVGMDLSACTAIEMKYFRVYMRDVEFPGLYFDIRNLTTESYNFRFTNKESPYYDLLTLDAFYNYTVVDGDTLQGYKQQFLSQFLPGPQGFGLSPIQTSPINQLSPIQQATIAANPQNFQSVAGNNGVNGVLPVFTDRSTTRIAESSAGYRLQAMWGEKQKLNLVVGSDFNYIAQGLREENRIFNPLQGDPNFPQFRVATTNGFENPLEQLLRIPNSFYYNPGLFFEMNAPVGDRWLFRMGARGDYARTTSSDRTISGNVDLFGGNPAPGQPQGNPPRTAFNPVLFSTDPTDDRMTRNFGLGAAFITGQYKFDDALTGLAAFGYAMRAPTLTELYSAGPFVGILQPGFNRLIGEPRLDPEKVMQMDLSLRADYGWFKGNVNGFYAFINDYITLDLNKAGGNSLTQVVFTNTDRATLAGGEMYGQVEATSWLTPFASLSYVEGRDLTHRDDRRPAYLQSSRRNGTETEPLPSIPPLEIRSGLRIHESVDYKTAPRWSIEGSCRTVFDQDLTAVSLNEARTPGFNVVDLRAFWRPNDRWTFTTGVENLNDKFYREHLDPRAGNLFYRPGINYYFTTQVTY